MKLLAIILGFTLLLDATHTACPSINQTICNGQDFVQQETCSESNIKSYELIGDIAYLNQSALTPVGRRVRNILLGEESAESDEGSTYVPPLNSQACAQVTCCVWWYIVDEMVRLFTSTSGRCANPARGAIRLGFHDAAGWSKYTGPGGGADGSIILAPEEMTPPRNKGLEEIVEHMKQWHQRWSSYGVSMADLIQMGASVGAVACPCPRIRTFVGRVDSDTPAPELLPGTFAELDELIQLFRDKTIEPAGLVALLGAHSTSQQRFVDERRAGDPQDSTPGVMDTRFYGETLGDAPPRVFKLRSDIVLSEDPRMFPAWRSYIGEQVQSDWRAAYAREYVRLGLLGVYNINNLTDCTWVLPWAVRGPQAGTGSRGNWADDQWAVDRWLNKTVNNSEIAEVLDKGGFVSDAADFNDAGRGNLAEQSY